MKFRTTSLLFLSATLALGFSFGMREPASDSQEEMSQQTPVQQESASRLDLSDEESSADSRSERSPFRGSTIDSVKGDDQSQAEVELPTVPKIPNTNATNIVSIINKINKINRLNKAQKTIADRQKQKSLDNVQKSNKVGKSLKVIKLNSSTREYRKINKLMKVNSKVQSYEKDDVANLQRVINLSEIHKELLEDLDESVENLGEPSSSDDSSSSNEEKSE